MFYLAASHVAGKKKWLQFRIRTLFVICLLAAIAICGYQWTRWPTRTLREFGTLVENEEFEQAEARLEFKPNYLVSPDDPVRRVRVTQSVCTNSCMPARRSLADFFYGRQTYELKQNTTIFVDTGYVRARFLIDSMTIERGKIRYNFGKPYGQGWKFVDGKWVREPIYW